ncbi:hypothetical protein IKG31_01530 [Candidatus Saccharibacteria bacterium]|nr:hypothetical protein [Candidatus Saccharibacteria bacterium]
MAHEFHDEVRIQQVDPNFEVIAEEDQSIQLSLECDGDTYDNDSAIDFLADNVDYDLYSELNDDFACYLCDAESDDDESSPNKDEANDCSADDSCDEDEDDVLPDWRDYADSCCVCGVFLFTDHLEVLLECYDGDGDFLFDVVVPVKYDDLGEGLKFDASVICDDGTTVCEAYTFSVDDDGVEVSYPIGDENGDPVDPDYFSRDLADCLP